MGHLRREARRAELMDEERASGDDAVSNACRLASSDDGGDRNDRNWLPERGDALCQPAPARQARPSARSSRAGWERRGDAAGRTAASRELRRASGEGVGAVAGAADPVATSLGHSPRQMLRAADRPTKQPFKMLDRIQPAIRERQEPARKTSKPRSDNLVILERKAGASDLLADTD